MAMRAKRRPSKIVTAGEMGELRAVEHKHVAYLRDQRWRLLGTGFLEMGIDTAARVEKLDKVIVGGGLEGVAILAEVWIVTTACTNSGQE